MAGIRKQGGMAYPWVHLGVAPVVNAEIMVGTVTVTPPTAGSLTIGTVETLSGFSISAGAYKVVIKHVGSGIEVGGTAGTDEDITVNGLTVVSGQELVFEAVLDPVTNIFKKVPAITVVNASGAGIWYQVSS